MTFDIHHHHHFARDSEAERFERAILLAATAILGKLEKIMIDTTKLLAVAARLQAADVAAIAALTAVRDQNKAAQAQIADLSKQLADLQAGADTTAVQQSLNNLADQLGASADTVEGAVNANPAVPDMAPATPAPAATAG